MADEPSLFALFIDEHVLSITSSDDKGTLNDKLAEELQLQEVLISAANLSQRWTAAAQYSGAKPFCELCERLMPPGDDFAWPPCPHALCRPCLCQYVDGVLHSGKASVKCPHATCAAVLVPEDCRGLIPPKLLDWWIDARRYARGREASQETRIRVLRKHDNDNNNTTLSMKHKDLSLQISIPGEHNRDDLLKRVDSLIDALRSLKEDGKGPKGKQLMDFSGSVTHLGQSSSSNLFYCNICMEYQQRSQCFDMKACSHMFCAGCIGQYVAAKVEENVSSIGCPFPGCKKGFLEPEMCRNILPELVFDRWGMALCESAIGPEKFYCPYKDCSALLINDGDDEDGVMIDAECLHCNRICCAQCKVPWHEGFDCEGFQKLGEDERGREDLMLRKLATSSKWQRCPHCRMFVEKIDGCSFINCRCGYCFCYVCASPLSNNYHFCEKCHR